MTTKRKPEDVVLNEEAVGKAEKVFRSFPGNVKGCLSASLRTYIAEADLIPRPQTVEEWAKMLPWDQLDLKAMKVVCRVFDYYGMYVGPTTRIPRPKPPRMTDEEIDKAAIDAAIKTHPSGERELTRSEEIAFYAGVALAERAKLEKERGNE